MSELNLSDLLAKIVRDPSGAPRPLLASVHRRRDSAVCHPLIPLSSPLISDGVQPFRQHVVKPSDILRLHHGPAKRAAVNRVDTGMLQDLSRPSSTSFRPLSSRGMSAGPYDALRSTCALQTCNAGETTSCLRQD
jgi:hypothetical protein